MMSCTKPTEQQPEELAQLEGLGRAFESKAHSLGKIESYFYLLLVLDLGLLGSVRDVLPCVVQVLLSKSLEPK
ncbi:unnamed protein product [Coccothraustes coccothraustes]